MINQLLRAALPPALLTELRCWREGSQRSSVGRALGRLRAPLLRLISRSGVLSSLYYIACSREFDREHAAVIRGRARYLEQIADSGRHYYMLRRNTHRLEKGLLMRPRRKVFATDYIEQTVRCYAAYLDGAGDGEADTETLRWTRDVLSRYFAEVGQDDAVERARAAFEACPESTSDPRNSSPRVPYLRPEMNGPVADYRQLSNLARRRRSVRWFLDEPVPRECIDRALEIAAQAPSACNRQPFTYRIYDEPELVRKVVSLAGGTVGYAHNVPVVVALVGELDAYFSERDRHLIYIDGGLSTMAFCLGLETQGLGSCCINWPDISKRERAMARTIGLLPHERVVLLIALGYPDPSGMVAYSQKKAAGSFRSYNRR